MEIDYFNGFFELLNWRMCSIGGTLLGKKTRLNLISLLKAMQGSKTRGHLNFRLNKSEQPKQISAWSCKCNKRLKRTGWNRFANALSPISEASLAWGATWFGYFWLRLEFCSYFSKWNCFFCRYKELNFSLYRNRELTSQVKVYSRMVTYIFSKIV